MPKTISVFMEKAQKQTIIEALYLTGDTHSTKEDIRKVVPGGPLRPLQARLKRPCPDKGKKSVFDKYTPSMTTRKEILNQVEDQNLLCIPNLMRSDLISEITQSTIGPIRTMNMTQSTTLS